MKQCAQPKTNGGSSTMSLERSFLITKLQTPYFSVLVQRAASSDVKHLTHLTSQSASLSGALFASRLFFSSFSLARLDPRLRLAFDYGSLPAGISRRFLLETDAVLRGARFVSAADLFEPCGLPWRRPLSAPDYAAVH